MRVILPMFLSLWRAGILNEAKCFVFSFFFHYLFIIIIIIFFLRNNVSQQLKLKSSLLKDGVLTTVVNCIPRLVAIVASDSQDSLLNGCAIYVFHRAGRLQVFFDRFVHNQVLQLS